MKQNHHRPEWKEVFQQAPVPDQKDAIMGSAPLHRTG